MNEEYLISALLSHQSVTNTFSKLENKIKFCFIFNLILRTVIDYNWFFMIAFTGTDDGLKGNLLLMNVKLITIFSMSIDRFSIYFVFIVVFFGCVGFGWLTVSVTFR